MAGKDRELIDGLLGAYRQGYFPMAEPARRGRPGRVLWFNPDPRAVLPLEAPRSSPPGDDRGTFHVSRSLRRTVRQGRFRITTDTCFEAVMRGCAAPRHDEPESWIDERIIGAYGLLHRAGFAHSIEAWVGEEEEKKRPAAAGRLRDEETEREALHPLTPSPPHPLTNREGTQGPTLVGGLYGVHIGGAFFAESKFSDPARGGTNASKVCLVHLVHHLRRRGFALLDVQFSNPHLEQFGIVEVSRERYLERLGAATAKEIEWLPFDAETTAREA